ncbi:MAG: threonine ammonia-lyase [Nitrososphaerales archaeon]
MKPNLKDVVKAKRVLRNVIRKTPLDYSNTFSRMTDCKLYIKLESLQKTGSFKVRGAYVKINSLSKKQKSNGVVAASAGNHGQGVAFASIMQKIPCTIVMPANASPAKVSATRSYGADVVLHGILYDQSWDKAQQIAEEQGRTLIHAFDDPYVIAGQGTIGLEILEELPNMDAIYVPIGGGGLAAGLAIAIKSKKPHVKVIGVQSKAFPAMKVSLDKGSIVETSSGSTIADGISVKRPGELTFEILSKYIDEVVTVNDNEIVKTMFLLMERAKLVVEPAGAAGLAYLISNGNSFAGKKVVTILTGGNVDMYLLGQIVSKGLLETGRMLKISIQLVDRPGELKHVVDSIVANRVNIVEVLHDRLSQDVAVGKAKVTLSLETEDKQHTERLMKFLRKNHIDFEVVS